MYFEFEIEYKKNIKGVYYTLTANKSYYVYSTRDLDEAIKTACNLIIENDAVITVKEFNRNSEFYCRFYNAYNKYGYVYKINDNNTAYTEDNTLTEIRKTIKTAITHVFEKCLCVNANLNIAEFISYTILTAAIKDINKIDSLLWKNDKGLMKADTDFIYNAYINYILNDETKTEEIKHLKRLLNYDVKHTSPHAEIIKKQLANLPEVMTA